MEIMDVLLWLKHNHQMATGHLNCGIIPMVLIPLTAVTVIITSIAGFIAGLFGIKLKTEGPMQFFEVLLTKRVLLLMLLFNLLSFGIYKSYIYVRTLPSFIFNIKYHSKINAINLNENYENDLSRSHQYYSLKAESPVKFELNLLKEKKLVKGAFRSGTISSSSIFYGVDDGNVYEIDLNSLEIKRKFFIGTQVTTRPVIFKNKIFFGEGNHDTHHARVYSFDLASGKFLNAFKTKGHTEGQPLITTYKNKDYLFVTAGVDGLYAVDPTSMNEIWHKVDGHLDATITIDKGLVYAGTGIEKGSSRDRSYAIAYQIETGKTIWKKELPISNWMHPITTNTDVCYVLGEIYFPSQIGLFHCLNKLTGSPHYSLPFEAPIASKPLYLKMGSKELAFFADFYGTAYGVDLNEKKVIWLVKTGNNKTNYALSSIEYDPQRKVLWYPSLDNGLFVIDPKSGIVIKHWLPNKSQANWKENYAAINMYQNNLYQLDIDGNLRKFEMQ
jgi:outer membrane protein assembly factor BamB